MHIRSEQPCEVRATSSPPNVEEVSLFSRLSSLDLWIGRSRFQRVDILWLISGTRSQSGAAEGTPTMPSIPPRHFVPLQAFGRAWAERLPRKSRLPQPYPPYLVPHPQVRSNRVTVSPPPIPPSLIWVASTVATRPLSTQFQWIGRWECLTRTRPQNPPSTPLVGITPSNWNA